MREPSMVALDCEDRYAKAGLWTFEPPAIVDIRAKTFRVLLCVHRPQSMMRLYVQRA